jgi:hypothetical protein
VAVSDDKPDVAFPLRGDVVIARDTGKRVLVVPASQIPGSLRNMADHWALRLLAGEDFDPVAELRSVADDLDMKLIFAATDISRQAEGRGDVPAADPGVVDPG